VASIAQKIAGLFITPTPSERANHVTDTEERTKTLTPQQEMSMWWGQSFNYSSSGATVTPQTILSIPAFYRAVNIISGVLCSMPLEVYSENAGGGTTTDKRHPVARLLNFRPSSMYTPYTFIETMILHLHVHGNFYAIIRRTGITQDIVSLDIVANPSEVETTMTTRNEPRYLINKQSYKPESVLHIKGISWDGILGEDTKTVHKENFGLALSIRQYLSKFFGNGAHLSGVLESPTKLVQDVYDRLVKSWKVRYGKGGSEEGGTAILENGITYKPISLSPADSGTTDQRRGSIADIALITGVPRFMLEESDPTFNNGETLTKQFVNYTILPLCERITDEINYKLFPVQEQGVKMAKFNLSKLLSADTEQRAKRLDTLAKWGMITPNEGRAMEDINPSTDPEANKLHFPVNMLPADLVGAQNQNTNGAGTGN